MARTPARETLRFNRAFYAEFYANRRLWYGYDLLYRQKRIAALLGSAGIDPASPGFAALEYGFGCGHLLAVVAGAAVVVGMEFSPSAIAAASGLKPEGHLHWELIEWDDSSSLPQADERFDLVTASHVLEHLDDDAAALGEWTRVLRPGGHLLVILPSNEVLFPGSKHLRTYDVNEFRRRLAEAGLEEIAVDEHQRFDRPFKHRRLILASRRSMVVRMMIDIPRTLAFLPAQLVSWRLLAALDAVLGRLGAPSSSIAYLFRKPLTPSRRTASP